MRYLALGQRCRPHRSRLCPLRSFDHPARPHNRELEEKPAEGVCFELLFGANEGGGEGGFDKILDEIIEIGFGKRQKLHPFPREIIKIPL